MLVDVSEVSTAIELMGARLELPVLVAPVAFQKLAHPDGEWRWRARPRPPGR